MKPAFDPSKAKLVASCQAPGILYSLCLDEGSDRVFAAGSDRAVYSVDLKAKKPTAKKRWTSHENYVSALLLIEDRLVSAGYDGRIVWADGKSGKSIRAIDAHKGWVRALARRGELLASAGDDMLVKLWHVETGKLRHQLAGHARLTPEGYATAIYSVDISPDGKTVAGGDRLGTVCIWDAETGKLVRRLQAPAFYTYDAVKRSRSIGGIRCVRFSPDGKKLAISGIGAVTNVDGFVGPSRVEVWDWRSGKRSFTGQDKHKAILNHVAFHPAGSWLIAAGGGDSGGLLAFWDLKREQAAHKVKPKGHIQQFVLHPDGSRILAAGHGGFQIWTCHAGG